MSGELPKGWAKTTLGESFELRYGKTLPVKKFTKEGYSVFGANGQIGFYSDYNTEISKVLITCRGATCGTINRNLPKSFVTNNSIIIDNNEELINTDYLQYAMETSDRSLVITGTAQPQITIENLAKHIIFVAPLNEQRRIVAKLKLLLEQVNICQKRLEKIPILLKRFRQAVLAAACSGKLTANIRENDTRVNDIPKSWTVHILKDLCDLITKGASPKWQGVNYTDKGVLFVTSENVGNGRLLLSTRKYVESKINEIQPRSVLRKDDLLTNIVGASIGRSAIYDLDDIANINQAVALIRLKAGIERRYVLYVLNSPSMLEYMETEKVDVARANLSLKDVAHFSIPVPPYNEQKEIIIRVEELFSLADKIEVRYAKAKSQVNKLTQSIRAKAFRGELVPQDPNDEPANILLKRIKPIENRFVDRKRRK